MKCGDGRCDPGQAVSCCSDCCGDGLYDFQEECYSECDAGIVAKILGPIGALPRGCKPPSNPSSPAMCRSTAIVLAMGLTIVFIRKRQIGAKPK